MMRIYAWLDAVPAVYYGLAFCALLAALQMAGKRAR